MADKNELEACPRCQSRAEVYVHSKSGLFRVSCCATDTNYIGTDGVSEDPCDSDDKPAVWYESESEAITAWNTPQEPKAELKELKNKEIAALITENANLRKQLAKKQVSIPPEIKAQYEAIIITKDTTIAGLTVERDELRKKTGIVDRRDQYFKLLHKHSDLQGTVSRLRGALEKTKELLSSLTKDIQSEIDRRPQYKNVGKRGCAARIKEILFELNHTAKALANTPASPWTMIIPGDDSTLPEYNDKFLVIYTSGNKGYAYYSASEKEWHAGGVRAVKQWMIFPPIPEKGS